MNVPQATGPGAKPDMTVLIAFEDSNSPRIMFSPLSPVATYGDQIVLLALRLVQCAKEILKLLKLFKLILK